MLQGQDQNGNIVPNTGYALADPIILASGAVTTAFLKKTMVLLTAPTLGCFYRISSAGTAASVSSHPLLVGASRYVPINIGDRIANTGGSLTISIHGASHDEPRTNYIA